MEQEKIDVASRARFMSRRLKIMNTSPALVKIEDNDDEETKRLLQKVSNFRFRWFVKDTNPRRSIAIEKQPRAQKRAGRDKNTADKNADASTGIFGGVGGKINTCRALWASVFVHWHQFLLTKKCQVKK